MTCDWRDKKGLPACNDKEAPGTKDGGSRITANQSQ